MVPAKPSEGPDRRDGCSLNPLLRHDMPGFRVWGLGLRVGLAHPTRALASGVKMRLDKLKPGVLLFKYV